MVNDTLYSKYISLKQGEEHDMNLSIEIDCNVIYFSQMKMNNDTLKIINGRKIRWPAKNIVLEMH
jgi:hypothetical protein